MCAGDEELAPFLSSIQECIITEKAKLKFYSGKIFDIEVVVLYSGVCKVNAAIATQILIEIFKVDVIINSGTAEGMNPKLNIFDTVISTEIVYHDVSQDILTNFYPWMKDEYFYGYKYLLELSNIKKSCTRVKFIS